MPTGAEADPAGSLPSSLAEPGPGPPLKGDLACAFPRAPQAGSRVLCPALPSCHLWPPGPAPGMLVGRDPWKAERRVGREAGMVQAQELFHPRLPCRFGFGGPLKGPRLGRSSGAKREAGLCPGWQQLGFLWDWHLGSGTGHVRTQSTKGLGSAAASGRSSASPELPLSAAPNPSPAPEGPSADSRIKDGGRRRSSYAQRHFDEWGEQNRGGQERGGCCCPTAEARGGPERWGSQRCLEGCRQEPGRGTDRGCGEPHLRTCGKPRSRRRCRSRSRARRSRSLAGRAATR